MVHDNETTFACLIESRMKALNINQVELERRSNITDTTWAAWRAGRLPNVKALWPIISLVLEVPFEKLEKLLKHERAKNRPDSWSRKVSAVINNIEDTKAWIDQQAPTPGEGV